MLWDFTYTDDNLTAEEASIIASLANGRALEFGSGRGLGTYALLAGRSSYILSIDEDEDYTAECSARYLDPRVDWLCKEIGETGWYDHGEIPVPATPEERYDTVLLDGPSGYPGRRHCLPMLLNHDFVAPGWQLIVTHTGLNSVQQFIRKWCQKFPIKREVLYCNRGIIRITAV